MKTACQFSDQLLALQFMALHLHSNGIWTSSGNFRSPH